MENELIKIKLHDAYIVDSQDIYYMEDLKRALINEIKRDTLENTEEQTIVKNNLELLEKVCSNKYTESFIIDELKNFGYSIESVYKVIKGLNAINDYFKYHSIVKTEENESVKNIEKVIKDILNYFND